MKKLDKLIFGAFIGPFFVTFAVVVFILLLQYMMKYFEEFVGKDLGLEVFAELFFYFSVNLSPTAYPLAVLLSCLIVFGNLGEHSELGAIKGAGVSLLRSMRSIFLFVVALTAFAYYCNDQIVPDVNLKAYSLLYDIRHTKPALDLKEGAFYSGIPNYSIRVMEKDDDGQSLGDIIIYDHSQGRGNTDVIFAETGSMSTFANDNYLMLELYDGYSYSEQREATAASKRHEQIHQFVRTQFDTSRMVFDLSSFDMDRTDQSLFSQHYKMKETVVLNHDIDSMGLDIVEAIATNFDNLDRFYNYHLQGQLEMPLVLEAAYRRLQLERYGLDSLGNPIIPKEPSQIVEERPVTVSSSAAEEEEDEIGDQETVGGVRATPELLAKQAEEEQSPEEREEQRRRDRIAKARSITTYDSTIISKVMEITGVRHREGQILKNATTQARYVKNQVNVQSTRVENRSTYIRAYRVERDKKLSLAVSCLVMFLIGAPLGAIIKRGGLGIPILISICFFVVFYIFMSGGEKWGKIGLMHPLLAVWMPNIVLLPFGLWFLRQARNDSRLLEGDYYAILWDNIKKSLRRRKKAQYPA